MPTIQDLAQALEAWAPRPTALSYDNVGLQVGDPVREVQRALIALDLTPAIFEEARAAACDLIITHHPLIFRPLKQVTTEAFVSSLVLRLAASGIALYSIHTNLDVAAGGVSFALAEQLGLQEVQFLRAPDEAATPPTGLGAVGQLPTPVPLAALLDHICHTLGAESLRFTGMPDATVQTVAVCGGSGSDLISDALAAGADAYLTADVTYHRFFEVLDPQGHPRMSLIDAGHYETEAHTETLLQSWLSPRFPGVTFLCTQTRTSPMMTHTLPPNIR